MSSQQSDEYDARQISDFVAIHNARNALATAWLRCESTDSLIGSLAEPEDPANYYVCRTLGERDLTDEQREFLIETVQLVLSEAFRDRVPSRMRPKLDRLLQHTASMVGPGKARELAHEQLQHRLASRRGTAIKVIRRLGADPSDMAPARRAVLDFRDIDAVRLLTPLPGGLSGLDCCYVIQLCESETPVFAIDDSYLGAIAIEGLARDGLLDHAHACMAHPLCYIRAVGRLKDVGLEGYLMKSVEAGGTGVLPMAVSVAGRLQLKTVLKELDAHIQRRIKDDPLLYGT